MEVASEFYWLHWGDSENVGVAAAPAGIPLASKLLKDASSRWPEIRMILSDGEFADVQPNDWITRLYSTRMRHLLDANRGFRDSLRWLPVYLHKNDEAIEYWVLDFPNPVDCLHRKSTYVAGTDHPIKIVLDRLRTSGHAVFVPNGRGTVGVIVSRNVRLRIEDAGLTNVSFSPVPVSE